MDRDSAARLELTLGHAYERAHRWDEAEQAYSNAARAHSAALRRQALALLYRVLERRESSRAGPVGAAAGNALSAGLSAVFTLLLTLLLVLASALALGPALSSWGKWRGKNKLTVFPSEAAGPSVTASSFPQAVSGVYELVRYHFERSATIWGLGVARMPLMVKSQTAEIVDLLAEAAPGAGKLLAWLATKARRPEYAIYSSLESNGTHASLTVTLERNGTPLRSWGTTFPLSGLFTEQRDVGYTALIFLKDHINANDAL